MGVFVGFFIVFGLSSRGFFWFLLCFLKVLIFQGFWLFWSPRGINFLEGVYLLVLDLWIVFIVFVFFLVLVLLFYVFYGFGYVKK